ncbi:unnamed protein product [Rhizophagus irregularis]|nr:unnamed protein product [Rhizophagus irregularis]
MESDLENFRQQWQQEILQQGQQNQDLKDVNVSIITNKQKDTINLENSTLIPLIEESKNDGLINSFRNTILDLLPLNPIKKIHISKLPNEINNLYSQTINSYWRCGILWKMEFALVCKKILFIIKG